MKATLYQGDLFVRPAAPVLLPEEPACRGWAWASAWALIIAAGIILGPCDVAAEGPPFGSEPCVWTSSADGEVTYRCEVGPVTFEGVAP